MIDLDDPATVAFLHSGCALLVSTVDGDGMPHAGRAWGLTVVDAGKGLLRVLLEADDAVTVANVYAARPIAVTATNVIDFHSIQLKGRPVSVEVRTPVDEAKQVQYTTDFLADVHEVDSYPIDLMERWAARTVVPCLVTVDSSFDQTPGPSAGVAIDRATL
jgi:hypothetical protein